VNTGKADIIISTPSVTPDRAKVIDFTRRYATPHGPLFPAFPTS
jgi:polar amino acid transport system substrate-binding protein